MLRAEGWRIAALPTKGNVISLSSIVDFLSGVAMHIGAIIPSGKTNQKQPCQGKKSAFPLANEMDIFPGSIV